MQRDLDLIRRILFAIEEHPHGSAPHPLRIDDYTPEAVGYHCYLIIDAGLATGFDGGHLGSPSPDWVINHLTSRGHDFVDAARSESVWHEVKEHVKQVGGWTMQALLHTLTSRLVACL